MEEVPDFYAPEAALMQAFAPDDDLRDTLLGALPKATRTLAREDPALNCVASVVAENFAEDETRPSELLQRWIAWRCGAMSSDFYIDINYCVGRCTSVALDSLMRRLARPLTYYERRFSYGLSRRQRGQWQVQVVVSDERYFEIQRPLKRGYAPGETLALKLRLDEQLHSPVAYIQAEGARVVKRELTENTDGTWELLHHLPRAHGAYFVELVADVERGSARDGTPWRQEILMFPAYVGAAKPPMPAAFTPSEDERVPIGEPRIESLLETYNAQRRKLGRPMVTWDAEIAKLAATRAELAAAEEQQLPPDDALDLKLEKVGISTERMWQTQAQFVVLPDYIRTQLLRPSVHLERLDTEEVRVGIGIAPRPAQENQPRSYSIVEYWVFPRAQSRPADKPVVGASTD